MHCVTNSFEVVRLFDVIDNSEPYNHTFPYGLKVELPNGSVTVFGCSNGILASAIGEVFCQIDSIKCTVIDFHSNIHTSLTLK